MIIFVKHQICTSSLLLLYIHLYFIRGIKFDHHGRLGTYVLSFERDEYNTGDIRPISDQEGLGSGMSWAKKICPQSKQKYHHRSRFHKSKTSVWKFLRSTHAKLKSLSSLLPLQVLSQRDEQSGFQVELQRTVGLIWNPALSFLTMKTRENDKERSPWWRGQGPSGIHVVVSIIALIFWQCRD